MIPEPHIVDASAPGDGVKAVSRREDSVGAEQSAPAHHLRREASDGSQPWSEPSYLKTISKSLPSENHCPWPGSLTCLRASDNPEITVSNQAFFYVNTIQTETVMQAMNLILMYYLFAPLTPHSPDGGGVAVAVVVGVCVEDTNGWLGSAQQSVKSNPSKPQGLLMA